MISRRTLIPLTWAGLLAFAVVSPASAQDPPAQQTPASGYVDPEGIPRRPPTPDIDPVYRGPSVDMMATIRQRGTLRVGVAGVEPMVMRDESGALSGFSIDLARRLADDLGVGVEFFETSWSHIVADLLDRHFDVIVSGMWVTPDRALVVNFSEPTSEEGIYLIANASMTKGMTTATAFDRPDVRLAVYPGTIQQALAAKRFPRATLVVVDPEVNEMDLVIAGKAHAALVPTFAPDVVVARAADVVTLPLEKPLLRTRTAIAMRKGDADFLNFVNSWLVYQRDGGWLDELTAHWTDVVSKAQ